MIFNFNSVQLSSLSGFENWGEFSDMKKMIARLEELRKNDEIHTKNNSVLMKGIVRFKTGALKQISIFQLAYIDSRWALVLPQ